MPDEVGGDIDKNPDGEDGALLAIGDVKASKEALAVEQKFRKSGRSEMEVSRKEWLKL